MTFIAEPAGMRVPPTREDGHAPSDPALADWCAQRLGSPVSEVLFEVRQLSRVLGFKVVDGREVVVKARPWEDRVRRCWAVQHALAERGFPCPVPLVAPEKLSGFAVTAEEYRPEGEQLEPGPDSVALVAGLLAELISQTPHIPGLEELQGSSPPWVGWDHAGTSLWPARDTPGPPLVVGIGPGWIDRVAGAVREKLHGVALPVVLGHGDWESQNLSWSNRRPYAVHDWDSAIAQPEPAVVGAAAAVWPAGLDGRAAATIGESADFLAAYQSAADVHWDMETRQLAWAAGLWVRTFNAKKDAADGGGPQLDLLVGEVAGRCERAGIPPAAVALFGH